MPVNVLVLKNKDEASRKAAGVIAETIRVKPDTVLGLATGSTPEGTYGELIEKNNAGEISFRKVKTFNLDEYLGLDGEHEQSYRYFMNNRLFDHVDIRMWNTHVLDGEAADPGLECIAFEQKILASGGVDVWLLGIGGNGHIAFNEPGSAPNSRTRIVNLTESTIKANSDGRFFKNPLDVPHHALSAGIGTIKEARKIILLALGSKKANIVKTAIEGPITMDCPASLLQDHPDVTFITDEEAASALTTSKTA